jgi:ABC-type phosphate/phosphonate transport system substrate-binding protein
LLRDGKVAAAILPTPLVREEIVRGAPDVGPELRQRLRQALLDAHKSDAGRAMLARIGLERFDPANATVYSGQGRLLKEYWGY